MSAEQKDIDYLFLPLRGGYLSQCGEEAQRWLQAVQRRDVFGLAKDLDQAMALLRGHDLTTANSMIQNVERVVAAGLEVPFSTIASLLRRYLFAVRAYLHYLAGDLEAAKRDLQEAQDSLTEVLSRHSFLMPMAIHFVDFLSQHARIARRQNRWKDAKQYIDMVRRIYENDHPFCILESGKPLYIADIRDFLYSLSLDEEQQRLAQLILGGTSPVERAEQLEEMVFSLPDLVIPYP